MRTKGYIYIYEIKSKSCVTSRPYLVVTVHVKKEKRKKKKVSKKEKKKTVHYVDNSLKSIYIYIK